MILVDTSVWVDFFKRKISYYGDALQHLVEEKRPICTTEIVLAEVLQGFHSDMEFETASRILLRMPRYSARSEETYVHAAQIYRKCRRNGYTPRGIVDCLIAAITIENDLRLLHNDKHFDRIAEFTALQTVEIG